MESGEIRTSPGAQPTAPAHVPGYRLDRELGRGGTGIVFAGEQLTSQRPVAVKLLRTELSQSRQAVARFFHEARSAASVSDPGIVDVYDSGYADDGSAYIAMALLSGESLSARLARIYAATLERPERERPIVMLDMEAVSYTHLTLPTIYSV